MNEDKLLKDLIVSSQSSISETDFKPTEVSVQDIDMFLDMLEKGAFDIKQVVCFNCGKKHIPNYGHNLSECDECFFARMPKEKRRKFFKSFFE